MTNSISQTPSYTSPLLKRPGAAPLADDSLVDSQGVAWHYGDPLGEQRAIDGGAAVIDRSHRRVVAITGDDAATFLNNLLTQKLDNAADGFSADALDLNIQGHILHQCSVTRAGDTFYLDMPSYIFEPFVDFLQKMIFWSQVDITEKDLGILTLLGTERPLIDDLPAAYSRVVDWDGVARIDLAVARGDLDAVVDKLIQRGAKLAGLMAFTAERVRAGEPELRADLDERSIPHEIPRWINRGEKTRAVHLEKGCYRGQETVARVENLGRSPRLLVLLQLDGSAPEDPAPGSDVTYGGRRIGRLGTVVHDCDYGPIALALLKRSAIEADELAISGESPVSAKVDADFLPDEESTKAGRDAIAKLRGQN
ncbi:folate-binding protein [Corynebacterium breve]|uniref:Folate-binding protein n=1 Tax=Corynebacterium breve TaxID=3049799 RepID=A0ABY8VIC2_9CORY|nr:folate-binding protein [Corynebacterium breve]WIM67310.1 folate-binding protein [Corynebacterium breve]